MAFFRFSGRIAAMVVTLFALATAADAAMQHRLDSDEIARLRGPVANGAKVRVEHVPLVDGQPAALVLERFEVFAPDANIVVYGQGGTVLERLSRPDVSYYRGHIEGDDDSLVFLSVSNGRVEGFVFSGDRKFSIASRGILRARGARDVEVFVQESDPADEIPADGDQFECDVEGARMSIHPGQHLVSNSLNGAVQTDGALATGTALWQFNLAIETDYELFVNSGSTAANVNTFIGNLIAGASTIYRREISTNLVVTYLGIQTSAADPFNVVPGQNGTWNGTTVTYSSSHALAELGDRWHNAATRPYSGARSSVVLVSGKPQMAGVAWIDTICEGDFGCASGNCGSSLFDGHTGGGYAYCGGVDPPADLSVPNPDALTNYQVPSGNYWPLLQFTHELGHNVGSNHTHCIVLSSADQSAYGRTFVDECYNGQGGCFAGTVSVPAEKGTIMSYCHLRSGGGTNSRFIFGKSGEASHVVPESLRTKVSGKTPAVSAISAPSSMTQGTTGAASVTGTGVSSYTWAIANGTINSGQGTSAINFTANANPVTLTITAAASFGCSVTDAKSVTVTAGSCNSPVITAQPAGATVTSGSTRTLSVTASGTAPLAYQWYIGASGVTTTPIGGATSATLSVAPAVTTSYWVRVSNACGSVNSNAATLTVTSSRDAQMDFDGDGLSEILWKNVSTGLISYWDMNGRTMTNGASFATLSNQAWRVQGFGDFNGDGTDDIVWRNNSTGVTAMWEMHGRTVSNAAQFATTTPLSWAIEAFGDFTGDAKDEIIWRNPSTGELAMWELNGHTLINTAVFATTPNTNWRVELAADFNGDGRDELILRNMSTGAIAMWELNGRTVTNSGTIATFANFDYQIAGAGDYNGDGKADLLWRNQANGWFAMWEMNGRTITNSNAIRQVSLDWEVERSGDFTGDGKDEIIWWNHVTGEVAMWEMNGHAVLNSAPFNRIGDLNWHVQTRGSRPSLATQ